MAKMMVRKNAELKGNVAEYILYMANIKEDAWGNDPYAPFDSVEQEQAAFAACDTEQVFARNLRLVAAIVKEFSGRGVDNTDLLSVGNLALGESIAKYDASKGCRFATFATYQIKAAIGRFVTEQGIVRIPYAMKYRRNLVRKAMSENPTWNDSEVANKLGMSRKQVRSFRLLDCSAVSLNAPIEDGELQDFIGESDEEKHAQAIEHAKAELAKLSFIEKKIIQERFLNEQKSTYHVIGNALGVSHENVRQIEASALRKLRKAM